MTNSDAKRKVFSNDSLDADFLSFELISFITFMVFLMTYLTVEFQRDGSREFAYSL